ncbi:MAG: cadmium-translocating P-type ATPase [Clostridia bacterium]|nr:cadmium-translocating P-type ATPase [Clostridia bacterium]
MRKLKKLIKNELFGIVSGTCFFVPALILEWLEFSTGALVLYILALIFAGGRVFVGAMRGILRRDLLDEKFLMSIAALGAMIIGECSEGVAVMIFFLVGEYFEHRAVAKSRKSIKSLMEIKPDEATVIREGVELSVDADEVSIGEVLVIRAGERVPLDCEIISGSVNVDTSAMTGESLPRSVGVGDRLDSGVIVLDGVIKCVALRVADESAAARVLELVEYASERRAPEESFITKFSHYYTPAVVGAAVLLAVIPPIFNITGLMDSVYRALSFLVVSCPCALVISVPMAFFGGIGGAASQGILFKGGGVFSTVAKAKTVAFDKTGTLTTGEFKVSEIESFGVPQEELISLAASIEAGSNHPLSKAITAKAQTVKIAEKITEISGKGVFGYINGNRVAVGNTALMLELGIDYDEKFNTGSVLVAKNESIIGKITLSDSIKAEAEDALAELRRIGIKHTVMLTGDKKKTAEKVANKLGIDEICAELMPEEKFAYIERQKGVIYVGDGINDAPALRMADVGVAMGRRGADSAIEAADLVIMSDNLTRLPTSVKIARGTVGIAKQNIVFAIGVKLAILGLIALGFANMWLAVFADVGVAVIAILNAMRALRVK